MMGKTDNQMQRIVLDIGSMAPQNHLLRQIKKELLIMMLGAEEIVIAISLFC